MSNSQQQTENSVSTDGKVKSNENSDNTTKNQEQKKDSSEEKIQQPSEQKEELVNKDDVSQNQNSPRKDDSSANIKQSEDLPKPIPLILPHDILFAGNFYFPSILHNIAQLNDIKLDFKPYSLKDFICCRNNTFSREYNVLPFAISTPILYKEKGKYKKYPLLKTVNNGIKVLDYYVDKKNKKKKNKSKSESESIKKNTSKDDTPVYDEFHPVLSLDFNLCTASMTINQKKFRIKIYILSTDNKVFKLKLPIKDLDLFKKIVGVISNLIYRSNGQKRNIIGIVMRPNFEKNYYIAQKQFFMNAKTGDILIFRGFECPARMQRFYTGSEYDHVALLVRKDGTLFVYEATSREGCKERQWREFIIYMWNLLYDKIVYRELLIKNKTKDEVMRIQEDLEYRALDFLTKTKGKKYFLSLKSVICGGHLHKYEKDNRWESSKGFSCSALVTGAYLNMGILKYTKEVGAVLPGGYAQDTQIDLNEPFELGPEKIIDFTE